MRSGKAVKTLQTERSEGEPEVCSWSQRDYKRLLQKQPIEKRREDFIEDPGEKEDWWAATEQGKTNRLKKIKREKKEAKAEDKDF